MAKIQANSEKTMKKPNRKSVVNKMNQGKKKPIKKNQNTGAFVIKNAGRTTAKNNTKRKRPQQSGRKITQKTNNKEKVRITFLGGINEVGKNITAFEYKNEMIIVDCGMTFPDSNMLGIDLVIPDFQFVKDNEKKLKAVFITHGHEDHIGSLPFFLKQIKAPVYATRLTIGLIQNKLKEAGILKDCELNVIKPGDNITVGGFTVEPIHVNHSIPDAVAFAIKTGAGTVIHSGDFKVDTTPIDGEVIDLGRFSDYGRSGVLALLCESTNAVKPGFTESEKKVGNSFKNLFADADGRRLIVATFASNIHRVQQIIDVAESLGRKVALSGRSLLNVVGTAEELGYIKVPKGILIDINDSDKYPPERLVIITTGSQGEPMSALYRMAYNRHRQIQINQNDYVIISATPIPGNEKMVGDVVDELLRQGAKVIYERMYDVHVSGHARQEEIKLLQSIVKPKFFIPIHGELKHMNANKNLAISTGIAEENIYIPNNGDQVDVSYEKMALVNKVEADDVFVDGSSVGDVGDSVLKDRRRLAEDGILLILMTIDRETGDLITGPDVISRGFSYNEQNDEVKKTCSNTAMKIVSEAAFGSRLNPDKVKARIQNEITHILNRNYGRTPVIIPVITEI